MMMPITVFRIIPLILTFLIFCSCGKSSGVSAGIPYVEPPVTKSTPAGLTSSGIMRGILTLDFSEIKSRFFNTTNPGPTDIKNLLQSIDSRISEINTRSAESTHDCLSATAVANTLTIFGQSVTAYFQCYDLWSDGGGGMLLGKKDNTWYLYTNGGQARSLAVVTPIETSSSDYTVEYWGTVGQLNGAGSCSSTWYGCSYGVIHLKANSFTKELEMAVAGTGIGYCGAQLKSDATNLYIKGSAGGYNGSVWGCSAADSACTLAANTSQSGTCTAINDSSFSLTSLGVTGSAFGTGITLDGTATDSIHFGIEVSGLSGISGVSRF